MVDLAETVRQVMRRWAAGVAVATSRAGEVVHGMTVNSFTSISLDPPLISVTLNNGTRTYGLVKESGFLGITFLGEEQREISDLFAGRIPEEGDRMAGLATFELVTGVPLIEGGLAFLDCRVVFEYPMPTSTLFIAEVLGGRLGIPESPLLYYNRQYGRLVP